MSLLSLLFGRQQRGAKFAEPVAKHATPEQSKAVAGLTGVCEPFVIVHFRAPDADCEQIIPAIRDALNAQKPDGWWLLPPTSFSVFFRSEKSGMVRAANCRDAIARIEVGSTSLRSTQFGQSEGDLIATYDAHGNLAMMPIGAVSTEALKQLELKGPGSI
jgi:hypothetical protein